MQAWQRFTLWLGALPLRGVTWGLALALSAWAVSDLLVFKLSSGIANSTYDAMVRARLYAPAADPRIVIIDIDEASLQAMSKEFGRWPWPRDTLATVLDHLEKQQPAAIAWDILFADPDRLSPGGDKAFDAAAGRSLHSHFSVTRLPPAFDAQSQLDARALPGLWLTQGSDATKTSTVALIAPALPSVAAGKLGFNNGHPDADGVLRRYRYAENLADGSSIQSIALAICRSLNAASNAVSSTVNAIKRIAPCAHFLPASGLNDVKKPSLIVWRKQANSYPRIPFSDVFAQAEGGKSLRAVPSFAGKIVLIGSTASSLHDIHASSLGSGHAGVDILATAIDNAINDQRWAELPAWLLATTAVLLVLAMAAWVLRHGVKALDHWLIPLPAVLLGISYASLHVGGLFIDLHLSVGIALLFIALLKLWNGWRHNYWCGDTPVAKDVALLPLHLKMPAADAGLDRLIRQLELHAPLCRVIGGDASATWPARLRWPEALHYVCIHGPSAQLGLLRSHLAEHDLTYAMGTVSTTSDSSRSSLAQQSQQLLVQLTIHSKA
ncbi:MAG: CHASE2 domain-containing protein [Brachymonas sp.]|nr:CHASE2 domain-containing protein [Brachymonas sp.]